MLTPEQREVLAHASHVAYRLGKGMNLDMPPDVTLARIDSVLPTMLNSDLINQFRSLRALVERHVAITRQEEVVAAEQEKLTNLKHGFHTSAAKTLQGQFNAALKE